MNATHYRIRRHCNEWIVRLFTDGTMNNSVGIFGPFATIEEADTAARDSGLIDGDK